MKVSLSTAIITVSCRLVVGELWLIFFEMAHEIFAIARQDPLVSVQRRRVSAKQNDAATCELQHLGATTAFACRIHGLQVAQWSLNTRQVRRSGE